MLKNYIIISLRNLRRNKLFSFINITGLSICISVSILLFIWIRDELSYDRFHNNADRIYRLGWNVSAPGDDFEAASVPFPAGPTLKEIYPEIHDFVRLLYTSNIFNYNDEKIFSEGRGFYADKTLFDIFSFELVRGNPETALSDSYSMVISEKTAQKYFGDDDPIGKTILLNGNNEYFVTGVLRNVPLNSHLQFDYLLSMTSLSPSVYERLSEEWFDMGFFTYLLINPHLDIEQLKPKLKNFYDEHIFKGQETSLAISFDLEPLSWIYLYSKRLGQAGPTGNPDTILIFITITFLIILLACVNYVLISSALATKRTREISIRKVLGSERSAIIRQFLTEAVLTSIIALFIAVSLAEIALPYLNKLANKNYTSLIGELNSIILGLPLFALIIGLAAGFYPAVYVSRFRPINIMKLQSAVIAPGKLTLRKILVVLQFIISAVIIISTIMIYKQIGYIKDKDLGFSDDSLLVIDFDWDREVIQSYNAIKQEFLSRHDITGVSASFGLIGQPERMQSLPFQSMDGSVDDIFLSMLGVDYNFNEVYDIEITAGRWFRPADVRKSIIVNETAARRLGYDPPADIVGQRWGSDLSGEIIGVVKDFHFKPLHQPVEPMAFQLIGHHFTNFRYITIASPVAYYFMTKWLENFAYRTTIGIGIFLLAMAVILLIALVTVSYQSMRAAYTNPVEALKYE